MGRVVVAASAQADLDAMVLTHSLPASTRDRVRIALQPLALFPLLGPALTGRWRGFRFILGPWPWMLCVYVYDPAADEVAVVTIQDSRSSRTATSQELPIDARAYADDVAAAGRPEATIDTYLRHAMFFVRWLAGDFEPGGRLA